MDSAFSTSPTPPVAPVPVLSPPSSDVPLASQSIAPAPNNAWTYWTVLRYGGIILIVALLGFNLFASLGSVTDRLTGLLRPIIGTAGGAVADTAKQTVDISAKGAQGITAAVADGVDGGVDVLERALSQQRAQNPPEPDDAGSSTQRSHVSIKSGYCYIGEDRGYRSCLKVRNSNECMSGDVFASEDQCVHPRLR
jgi:hypothetical protein